MIALLITLPAKQNSNNANFNYDITSRIMTIESCLQLRSQQGVALALSRLTCTEIRFCSITLVHVFFGQNSRKFTNAFAST